MTVFPNEGRVNVVFDLPVDEEGWPPVAAESVWATPLAEPGHVRLDNIPWFVLGAAMGDVFRVRADEDGVLHAVDKVSWSGTCTIRVVVLDEGPLAGEWQQALAMFAALGVDGEGIEQYGMVALNVPPNVDLAAVKGLLADGVADGSWDYDEGCVGDAWLAVG